MLTVSTAAARYRTEKKMPHIALSFDAPQEAAMKSAASRISAGASFTPQASLRVPVFGALHAHSAEDIMAAIEEAPMIRGRFLRWELCEQELRAVVELEHPAALIGHLRSRLPRGRPWKSHYVTLGKLHGIDASRHGEFLTAVTAAFPIDTNLTFTTSKLQYHDEPTQQHDARMLEDEQRPTSTRPATQKTSLLNPKARPFVPSTKELKPAIQKKKTKKSPPRPSPHQKWERASTGASQSIDALIKTGVTGRLAAMRGTTNQPNKRNNRKRSKPKASAMKVAM